MPESSSGCAPPFSCPGVASQFLAFGGREGDDDGHIRSAFTGLITVGGTSTGTWASPEFTYREGRREAAHGPALQRATWCASA
jgi:hypothetical protein